jgi:hypothetical protein
MKYEFLNDDVQNKVCVGIESVSHIHSSYIRQDTMLAMLLQEKDSWNA